jgi:hypothetical protein
MYPTMAALVLAFASPAFGQAGSEAHTCVAPTPPTQLQVTAPVRPTLPTCVDPKTKLSRCSAKVNDDYNQRINAFNVDMTRAAKTADGYIDQLQAYDRAARDYGNCEIDRINKTMHPDGAASARSGVTQ